MAESLQKKSLDPSPDETRTFDHGELKTATIAIGVATRMEVVRGRKAHHGHR
jgi:hypothetical protein